MLAFGYRFSVTGVFGCEYFDNHGRICAVESLVIPNPPLSMHGWDLSWRTDFDRDVTIVPGQRLPIKENDSERNVAEIITKSFSSYSLTCKSEEVIVTEEKNTLVFRKDGLSVATCRRAKPNEAPNIDLYGESTKVCYVVELALNVSNELKLLIFSFPNMGLAIPTRAFFAP